MGTIKQSPSIILVNTQLGENIGAAARAMANFGLSDLRLVAPKAGWPNERAYDMASTGSEVLDSAKLYATTQEAVSDLQYVYATTARPREMKKPVHLPQDACENVHAKQAEGLRVGLLFGPERTGLTNEDSVFADAFITIPTAPEASSLNIAQSVVVMAYQFAVCSSQLAVKEDRESDKIPPLPLRGEGAISCQLTTHAPSLQAANCQPSTSPTNPDKRSPLATRAEIQGFFDQLEAGLDEADFWKVDNKKPIMWQNLRSLFIRSQLSEQEVRTLRGMVRALMEGRRLPVTPRRKQSK